MGAIVVSEFITLDGVFQDPGGSGEFARGGWAFQFDRGPEGNKFKFDEVMAAGALLLGRITYEGFAKAWPGMHDEFADKMNTMPKFVVSSTLADSDATWQNSTVLRGDALSEVTQLRDTHPGDLLVAGSAALVQMLVDDGLVDELRLMVFPIVLGSGKRLFGEVSEAPSFTLGEMETVGGGVVVLTYHPLAAGPATGGLAA